MTIHVIRKSETQSMRDMENGEFRLVAFKRNAAAQVLTRISLTAAGIAGVALVVAGLVGVIHRGAVMFFGLGVLIALAVATWRFWVESRGVVRVDQSGIVVQTGSGTHVYPWVDIAELRLTTLAETGRLSLWIARLVRLPTDAEFVEIGLRRYARVAFVPFRTGTRATGIPKFLSRRVWVQVILPLELLDAAKRYLQA